MEIKCGKTVQAEEEVIKFLDNNSKLLSGEVHAGAVIASCKDGFMTAIGLILVGLGGLSR